MSSDQIAAQTRSFDLEAGNARTTLREFARQALVDVVMDRRDVQGVQTNEVSGLLEPRIALERMLEGTQLVFNEDLETGAFAVTRSEIPSPDQTTQNTEPQILDETEMNIKQNNWLKTLAAVLTLGIATTPEQTYAQEETEGKIYDLERFEIIGFRASLERQAAIKRNADNIIDGISAEDIGKLPDTNIAESLARIPGIQIQRENGEGAFVSVRGLDPTFTKVTVNGQSLTAARSRAGQTGFNLSILGSSIPSRIEVIKSPTADMEEGGVGGSINIIKLRPFDLEGYRFSGTLEAVHEEQRDKFNPRINLFVSDIFADDTLGISFQGYFYEREFQRTRVRGDGVVGVTLPNGEDGVFQSRIRPRLNQDIDENYNLSSTLEWRPSDKFNAYVDLTYGRTNGIDRRYDSELRFRDSNINFVDPSYEVNADGFVTTMPVNGFRTLGFGGFSNTTTDEVVAIASGFSYDFNDRFNMEIEAAYSWDEAVNDDLPSFGGAVPFTATGDTIAILNFDADGSPSGVSINDVAGVINFDSIMGDNLGSRFGSSGTVETTLASEYSIKADFEHKTDGPFSSFQFGFKYTNREESEVNFRRHYNSDARSRAAVQAVGEANQLLKRFDDYVNLFPGLGKVTGVDVRDIGLALANDPGSFDRVSDGVDDELFADRSILAGYGLGRFTGELGSLPIQGNVGVRIVQTDTDTRGFGEPIGSNGRGRDRLPLDSSGNPIGFIEVKDSKSDFEVLPALNFTSEIARNFQVRFAAARVMRRAEIRELTPFFEIDIPLDPDTGEPDFDINATSGEAGNSRLDPFLANQLDLSFEYYPKENSLFAIGVFHKNVKNFITQEILTTQRTIIAPDGSTRDVTVLLNQYVNGGGAEIYGVEAIFQQAFSFLPAPFDGFGTALNYTFTKSEDDIFHRALPGTSEDTFNATLYYERERFGARLAYNFRGKFPQDSRRFRQGLSQLDASYYYKISDHLKLTITATNLTNEPFLADFHGSSAFPASNLSASDIVDNFRDYELSGRQFFFGLGYHY